jgi:hypothetical protein
LTLFFTIFSNEITAIKETMTYILQASDLQFSIVTDSKSTVVAIRGPLTTNEIVQEIQSLSTAMHNNHEGVSLVWIPSRQGMPGNEKMDRTAKEASALTTHVADLLTPHSCVVAHTKRKLRENWYTLWHSSPTTELHAIRTENAKETSHFNLKRRRQAIITRVRTGHSNPTHTHMLAKGNPPVCNT